MSVLVLIMIILSHFVHSIQFSSLLVISSNTNTFHYIKKRLQIHTFIKRIQQIIIINEIYNGRYGIRSSRDLGYMIYTKVNGYI